jgi:hypothetical protein
VKVVKMNSFPIFAFEDDNVKLMEAISKEELQVAMNSFLKDKILGPNGGTIKFFWGCRELIEDDLLKVVEELRKTEKVIVAFNSIIVALIPRKENFAHFHDFRPISPCNYIYKIFAKIIALRVKRMPLSQFRMNSLGSHMVGKFMMSWEFLNKACIQSKPRDMLVFFI